ncbi:MAG TPA: STAS domain-containing protein [Umezawaea sp.]|nr:STAS domain-containing protein [Umezawaea sp.]
MSGGRPAVVSSFEAWVGVTVVRVVGDLGGFSGVMRERCLSLLDVAATAVVLDLSGVSFFDSSGLTDLLVVHHSRGPLGSRVRLVVGGFVRRRLEITGTATLLPLHESLADALAAMSAGSAN